MAILARRLTDAGKSSVPLAALSETVTAALAADQAAMLATATDRQNARIAPVATVEEAVEACATGWARMPWSTLGEEGEARLAESAISVRCLQREDGSVPERDVEENLVAFVGRSY